MKAPELTERDREEIVQIAANESKIRASYMLLTEAERTPAIQKQKERIARFDRKISKQPNCSKAIEYNRKREAAKITLRFMRSNLFSSEN